MMADLHRTDDSHDVAEVEDVEVRTRAAVLVVTEGMVGDFLIVATPAAAGVELAVTTERAGLDLRIRIVAQAVT